MKKIYNYNNRTFVCYVGQGVFRGSAEVNVWEDVHPERRFFKFPKYKGSEWFWVDDYPNIE